MNTSSLTKEQLRHARLVSLGLATDESSTQSPAAASGIASMEMSDSQVSKRQELSNFTQQLSAIEFHSIQKVLYKGGFATDDDMVRWCDQGFNFCGEPYFGLYQKNGGPCGILAVVQAEIIRELVYPVGKGNETVSQFGGADPEPIAVLVPNANVDQSVLLATALCTILSRVADGRSVKLFKIGGTSLLLPLQAWQPGDLTLSTYKSVEDVRLDMLNPETGLMELLHSPLGCIAFLISIVASRGVDRITADMDDPDNTRKLSLLLLCLLQRYLHSQYIGTPYLLFVILSLCFISL
jgi:hypothetical protein